MRQVEALFRQIERNDAAQQLRDLDITMAKQLEVTGKHKNVHGEVTYWFCSAGCQAEFEKTPERYLRPIEA